VKDLEVLALTNPVIRGHPYVARLLAWSYDAYTMNTPLYLVMKLAQCSLREFLQNQERGAIHISLKHQFCRNIAAGIDVLHECGLIHGDPKPDNILVFKDRKDMFVAKVADFGLSIAEVAPDTASPNVGGVGGTFGWQAPEVEQSKMVPRHLWASTDNYSFGLLIWSVLLLNGDAPSKVENTSRILLAREQMEALENQLHRDVGHSLTEAVSKLLHDDPLQRPIHLESLFHKSTDQRL
jgi:serine/threonine protein kinase